MSIYAQLLGDALGQAPSPEGCTTGDALAQLLEQRDRLTANLSSYSEPYRAPAAIAVQLAYDVALVEFARRLGIEVDLTRFGQPRQERDRLEQALMARGVDLGEFEEPTELSKQPRREWGRRRR